MIEKNGIMAICATLLLYLPFESPTAAKSLDDSFALQCGALYGVLAAVYEELKDNSKSSEYLSKYEYLKNEVEKLYIDEKTGNSQVESDMQVYTDEIEKAVQIDRQVIPDLLENCNIGLQSFNGLTEKSRPYSN